MKIETVSAPPSNTTQHVGVGKYGPFIEALRAQKEGWLRIAYADMPHLANNKSKRVALRQVATRHGMALEIRSDENSIYLRRTSVFLRPPR